MQASFPNMSVKTKALSEKLAHVTRFEPLAVPDDCTVKEAIARMREKEKPVLMICKGKKLVGIFTERDYLMKVVGRAKPADPIREYMTPNPVIGSLDRTLGETIEVMNEKGLRNLPIVDEHGAPASVVTVISAIQYLADHFPAAVVNRPPQPHVVSHETDGA